MSTPPISSEDHPGGAAHADGSDDAAALAEDVEVPVDLRRQLLQLHRGLADLDHYKVLGLERDADKKAVKRAYFDLAAKFHPDKYFRKRLGSFKVRMEAIFARATIAYETLGDGQKRVEYDAYLREQSRARGIEDLIADALDEVRRAEERAERDVRAASTSSPASSPSLPPVGMDAASRREALARRLLGGRTPASQPARAAPRVSSGPPPRNAADAVDSLRRRYEERVRLAKATQARQYAARADEALAAGDPVAAANALRVASGLEPENVELGRRAQEIQGQAATVLAETYTRQAAYEEKQGQWVDAARSWGRAAKARPDDAHVHERAANAIVKAQGDLHEAARLATRACELDPSNGVVRITLASVYTAAGLALNARRELDAAAQLAPHDATIQAMIRRMTGTPT